MLVATAAAWTGDKGGVPLNPEQHDIKASSKRTVVNRATHRNGLATVGWITVELCSAGKKKATRG